MLKLVDPTEDQSRRDSKVSELLLLMVNKSLLNATKFTWEILPSPSFQELPIPLIQLIQHWLIKARSRPRQFLPREVAQKSQGSMPEYVVRAGVPESKLGVKTGRGG